MNLAAGAAGAGVTHFPEVVVLVSGEHVVRRHVLEPGLLRLRVQGGALFRAALEDGGVELGRINHIDFREQFPRPVDGFFLKVVPETPVAQHLEHRVVTSVVAHGFQVIVLAAHAEALLTVGRPGELGGGIAQEDVLELVHARVGEHQRGVVLDDHGGRRHHRVSLGGKEVQVFLSNFFCCHICCSFVFCILRLLHCPVPPCCSRSFGPLRGRIGAIILQN